MAASKEELYRQDKAKFDQEEAHKLLASNIKMEVPFTENVNDPAEGSPDAVLIQNYVLSHPNFERRVIVRPSSIRATDYSQIIQALNDFANDDHADALLIPISLEGRHATHAFVTKLDDEKFLFEYSDSYGKDSPYATPPHGLPEGLHEEVEKSLGKGEVTFKIMEISQQSTSESCFAINYQNMKDKYQGKPFSIKSITSHGEEDGKVREVRVQMKKDLGWIYDQYNSIKTKVIKSINKDESLNKLSKKRIELKEEAKRQGDVFDIYNDPHILDQQRNKF
ncbi:MAG: hypothetical protein H0U71_07290 [Gammaproteobacteria bacterium]|nr:hypothetical protein [Gammaproteobacteria bacterium]